MPRVSLYRQGDIPYPQHDGEADSFQDPELSARGHVHARLVQPRRGSQTLACDPTVMVNDCRHETASLSLAI
ncbi:MAG TPA: hypothetical protein VHS97_07385, partial [Isosphaeraceae bacterium]|nr:hypothetical protein [Isosphaeraceae bacterium]